VKRSNLPFRGTASIGANFVKARTLANMNVALERVCQRMPDGEDHRVRKLVARRIIQCAKIGNKTLGALTKAGERFEGAENSRQSA
jgi:hypothetical protein